VAGSPHTLESEHPELLKFLWELLGFRLLEERLPPLFMLWLIDGYNLMHAMGAVSGKEAGPEVFRRNRRHFLNVLADSLGLERARETTVVFDANSPPRDFDLETGYKGLTLIFALGDENADARIERLIAQHSAPKSLTVVSTDRRIRRAAARRKARALTADEFLNLIERPGSQKTRAGAAEAPPTSRASDRDLPLSPDEAAYWLEEFGDLEGASETRAAFEPGPAILTDAEIDQIQREIDREG
jgi:uncharacterized protein